MEQEVKIIGEKINFNKHPSTIVKWGMSNLPFLLQEISVQKRIRILIAGCGTGRNAHYLSKLGHDIVGFDISKENVDLANDRYLKHPVEPQYNFFVHDLREGLPFDDESFDLIIDIFVYNEQSGLEIRKKYQQEISRVLRNNGYVLMGVHCFDDEYFLTCNLLENRSPRVVFDSISKKEVLCYSDDDLRQEVEQNFQIVMKWVQEKQQIIEQIKYLRKYLATLLKKV